MTLSRTLVGRAVALLFMPVVLAGTYALTAERRAGQVGQDAETSSLPTH